MFRRIAPLFLPALAALALAAPAAHADPLVVTSYDMPNGDGTAHGGTYNYWDATYDGHGHRHHDGSFLHGGTGALTDGVIATGAWNAAANSNPQGTGEYVGWKDTSPTITFHFGSTVTIDSITLYVDNSVGDGILAPGAVIVDGTSYSDYADSFTGPGAITLNGLDIVGNSVTLTLTNHPESWVFMSEISFEGVNGFVTSVPEPGNVAMVLAGLGLMGWMARRRRA